MGARRIARTLLAVSVLAAPCTTGMLAQDLILYEGFDYPDGVALNDQEKWSGDAPGTELRILNGDNGGDDGTSSLGYPGLTSQGGRLKSVEADAVNAHIEVRNRTEQLLQINVYMQVRPGGRERTWLEERLPPGGARGYRLSYTGSAPGGSRELVVGIVIPGAHSYVNKVYPLR